MEQPTLSGLVKTVFVVIVAFIFTFGLFVFVRGKIKELIVRKRDREEAEANELPPVRNSPSELVSANQPPKKNSDDEQGGPILSVRENAEPSNFSNTGRFPEEG